MSTFIKKNKASGLSRGQKSFDLDSIIGAIPHGYNWRMVSDENEMLDNDNCIFGTDPYEIAIQIQELNPVPANCIKVIIPDMDTESNIIETYKYPVYMSTTIDIENIINISKEYGGVHISDQCNGIKEERFQKECVLENDGCRSMNVHIEGINSQKWASTYLVQHNPTKAKRKFNYDKNKEGRAKKSGEIDCYQISSLARALINVANSFLIAQGLGSLEFSMIKGGKSKAENMLNVANIIKAFKIFKYTDYRLNEKIQKDILKYESYVEGLISRKGMKTAGSDEKYQLGCILKSEIAAIKKIQKKKEKG